MKRMFFGLALSVTAVGGLVGCDMMKSSEKPSAGTADMEAKTGSKFDPQMKTVLDRLADLHGKPIEQCTPAEARKQPTAADAAMAELKREGKSTAPIEMAKIDNKTIDGPDNTSLPIRIYTPQNSGGPLPVIVYYHGGGFVIATIDTYDSSCRALASMSNAIVVAVEYRKAPEHKYPAAVDDSFAAYQWVLGHANEFDGSKRKVAVAGESAGGNLATVVSMKAKEAGIQMPVFQLLVYPVVNNDMMNASYTANAMAKPLNKAMMEWFFQKYLDDPKSANDPHVLPMKATQSQLAGLPPAMVITDSIDPLMTEGKMYADKLKAAGVPVEYKNYDGVTHEFFGLGAVVDKAKFAEMDASKALKDAFMK